MGKRAVKTRIKPNDAKFGELILYIARKSESDPNFGATKLNKLLWLADFVAYGRFSVPITGQEYQKLERGPAPRRLLPISKRLIERTEAAIQQRDVFGHVQHRIVALREADLSEFSGAEIALVDRIISDCWPKRASDISDDSHIFPGWKAAKIGETIPYATAFLSSRKLTEKERQYGLTIDAACRG